MPRRSKGARLQLKAVRRDESGNITHRATWIIRDNVGMSAQAALQMRLQPRKQS